MAVVDRSVWSRCPSDQQGNDALRSIRRIIAISMNDEIRMLRWLIHCLQSWDIGGLTFACLVIDAFGIAAHTSFQGAFNVDFQKSLDLLPSPIAIGSAICGRIEDDRNSVIDQDTANEC